MTRKQVLGGALQPGGTKNHSEVDRSLFVIQPVSGGEMISISNLGYPPTHGPSAASFLNLRNPYFISGDSVPTGMGGRGISLVRGGGSTPTTGRGWMSTGATGLDWTTGGD